MTRNKAVASEAIAMLWPGVCWVISVTDWARRGINSSINT